MDLKSKIILISGPTASGKSKLALKIAKKINGEIINADSMQVYKELKILTARPSEIDLKKIELIQLMLKDQSELMRLFRFQRNQFLNGIRKQNHFLKRINL